MPADDTLPREIRRADTYHLGHTLLRLEQNRTGTRAAEELAEERIAGWHRHWSRQRRLIATRLESIDERLESLFRSRQVRPQFGLIGTGFGDDETFDE